MDLKKVLLICADGCEDIETISQIDILNRASINITIATANIKSAGLTIKAANGTIFQAHNYLEDCENNIYDLITLPGGLQNAETLSKHELVIKMLKKQKNDGKWYAAICATPAFVFQPNGLLDGELGTCYPALSSKLLDQTKVKEKVVISNKCITSQGPATSIEYSLALVAVLKGEEAARELGKKLLFY